MSQLNSRYMLLKPIFMYQYVTVGLLRTMQLFIVRYFMLVPFYIATNVIQLYCSIETRVSVEEPKALASITTGITLRDIPLRGVKAQSSKRNVVIPRSATLVTSILNLYMEAQVMVALRELHLVKYSTLKQLEIPCIRGNKDTLSANSVYLHYTLLRSGVYYLLHIKRKMQVIFLII